MAGPIWASPFIKVGGRSSALTGPRRDAKAGVGGSIGRHLGVDSITMKPPFDSLRNPTDQYIPTYNCLLLTLQTAD